MKLSSLAMRNIGIVSVACGDLSITGVEHDSRAVKTGDLFVCLVGGKFDGHKYLLDAVARGALAVVIQEDHWGTLTIPVPTIVVRDTRKALPHLAAAIYGDPSRSVKMVGCTGTNGKTTTVQMAANILRAADLKTGTIGTLGADFMLEPIASDHTTPEADHLQRLLANMLARGAQAVAMEVSSHALAQYRADSVEFDVAAFTNLTQDHLDYHINFENYFNSKLRLFTYLVEGNSKPFTAVLNIDDARGEVIAKATPGRVLTYAVRSKADIVAEDIKLEAANSSFVARTVSGDFKVELPIGGAFQVYNALAAIGIGIGLGISTTTIQKGLETMKPVAGRFEPVATNRLFNIIVDYAHTPDGLKNLIRSARGLNPTRIIVVFGCGGNRDKTKRPIMGKLAAYGTEIAIVTSDNPRYEDPEAIIQDILPGMVGGEAEVIVEPDRRAAIARSISIAKEGDIILIAGKGHEDYQLVGDQVLPFDDCKVARELLGIHE